MTREEQIDAWLAAEMPDADRRTFEKDMAADPELQKLLARQAAIHEALGAALGGARDEKQIVDSVIAALQAKDTTEVATGVVQEVLSRKGDRRLRTSRPRRRPPAPSRRRRGGRILLLAAAASLLVVIGFWIRAARQRRAGPQPDLDGVEVVAVRGDTANVRAADRLRLNQEVRSGGASTVSLRFPDGTQLTLAAGSQLRLTGRAPKRLVLDRGELRADVQPQTAPLVIRTPHATATVLGTAFTLRAGSVGTRLDVGRGKVELRETTSGAAVVVTANRFAVAAPNRPLRLYEPGLLALYEFDETSGRIIHNHIGTDADLNLRIGQPGNVAWLAGGLRVSAPADIVSTAPATAITEACRQSGEISIEAWIRPLRVNPLTRKIGMDRIVTISADSRSRNVSLGQGEMDQSPAALAVRLRRSEQTPNGLPAVATPELPAVAAAKPMHVVFVRDKTGKAAIWVNGQRVAADKLAGTLSSWDPSFRLALAQEVSPNTLGRGFSARHPIPDTAAAKRFWQGEFHRLAFYDYALSRADIRQRARR